MKKRKVVFSIKAKSSLRSYIEYLKNNVSRETAEHVRKGLVEKCQSLSDFAGYSKERYLEDQSIGYRSVNQWNYNIIYTITEKEVRILIVIHTKQHQDKRKDV